jgi:cell pole-organizing protein PopZ
MEDILASIRKMISEERLGPRPLPDQMSRTPFGETAPADPAIREAVPEKKRETADTQPSFSSLADALKAAARPSAQHRTLDEKIADMLDKGPASPAHPIASDPLAVFAAARPRSTEPAGSGAFGRTGRTLDPLSSPVKKTSGTRPAREESPLPSTEETLKALGRSLNMPGRSEPKPTDIGIVVPLPGEASSARRDALAPREASGAPASPDDKKPDDKTVISIPTRGAGLFGSTLPGAPRNGSLNGSTVAPFGLRPLPGSIPSARADGASPAKDDGRPDEPSRAAEPSLEDVAKGTRPATGLFDTPKPFSGEPNFDFLGGSPEETPVEDESADRLPEIDSADDVPGARSDDGDPLAAVALGAVDLAEGESGKLQGGPSEALLDAVVDMVHSEPSSLSVFTSGSAFINGVGTKAIIDEKPEITPDTTPDDKPKDPRKLDRAAAELLRPMLRQWLAENMPRIVEEALRSELDSTTGKGKDPDEA